MGAVDEVRYALLGPMELTVAGEPVKLPGAAERALLAQLLLVPGRTVPATLLVDRLWSDSTLPVDPMNALQIRVSKLRRALKAVGVPELVAREGVGYRAAARPDQVDALDFADRVRTARQRVAGSDPDDYPADLLDCYDDALALWRGEPLSDFATEQWAMAEAARLTELRLAALSERTQVALALGRHQEVVGDLEPVVAGDPTLESMAGLLMVALYRSGRQADALDVFTRTREVLDETLGLEPAVSLRSLHERVLRQDESLGAPQISLPSPAPSSGARRARPEPLHERATNLPTVVRPLIGRDDQLEELVGLLGEVRLLSLIGPGGAGKTALATATAVRVAASFTGGAFGVRLASVDTPEQVPLAVADAIGVPLDGAAADRDVTERLLGFLERRQMLLLVDNCEHVVDAVAALVDDLLGRCPEVTVLATSREALAIPLEVQLTVGPLAVPPDGTPPGGILDFPASQLFAERSRSVRPGAVFGEADLVAIGNICRALDGIPLALELAAARVAAMSPVEIAARLEQRFSFLTSGHRTAEARQQTLRATVDWSYALLSEREQVVFNRLSVFQGGWTLSAAEQVVGHDGISAGAVLDTVGRLVERSMVVVEPGASTRYRMLETLRQYAAERLHDAAEAGRLAQRHAAYFREETLRAERALRGHGQRDALRRLREEQPNIRSAIAWFTGPGGDPDSALLMAGSLGLFWHLGRHLEGRELLASLVEVEGVTPATLARALQAVSIVERPRGCLVHPSPRCAETAAASLALFDELGDGRGAALSRVLLAVEGVTGRDRERSESLLARAEEQFRGDADDWGAGVIGFVRMETALKGGDEAAAVRIGRSAAAVFRELDDPWGLSAILYHLGWGLRQFGRYADGARVLEEAIDVAAGAGLYNTVQWALADLGIAEVHQGNGAAARDHFRRAADASQHIGDGAGEVLADYGFGLLALVEGDHQSARERFAVAHQGFRTLGTPVPEGFARLGIARCDEATDDLDAALAGYDEAIAVGRRAGEQGVVAGALEGLARIAVARGDTDVASTLLAEARELRTTAVRPAPPHEEQALADIFGVRDAERA